MSNYSRREHIGILTIIVVVAGAVFWSFVRPASSATPGIVFRDAPAPIAAVTPAVKNDVQLSESSPIEGKEAAAPAEIVVQATGAIKKPGVYHLPIGARGEDVLKAAGGAKPDANLDALNLAAKLEDGAQMFFPTRKEQPKGLAEKAYEEGNTAIVVANPEPKKPVSTSKPASKTAHGGKSDKFTVPGQGYVNINTANAEALQKLPNVGPAMAERILTFRQEMGKFQAPEDLLQVSGIGPKKFERMKPFVKVK